MNPATKVETSWCNVFPVQLMSQSGIHVTVDPIVRGHDCGQIGLSEFRPDPLAEVKKVKTPLMYTTNSGVSVIARTRV